MIKSVFPCALNYKVGTTFVETNIYTDLRVLSCKLSSVSVIQGRSRNMRGQKKGVRHKKNLL